MTSERQAILTSSSKPLAKTIQAKLKEDILAWRLKPGETLQEVQLAEQFGVSRTPIRESLRELASEGMVYIVPQKGAVVSDVSIRDVLEAYQVRELIEPAACAIAARRISDDAISALEEIMDYHPADNPTHEELVHQVERDRRFHELILETAGNQLLKKVALDMRDRTIRVQYLIPQGRPRASRQEHLNILQLLISRDPEKAEAAMRDHLRNAKSRLVK